MGFTDGSMRQLYASQNKKKTHICIILSEEVIAEDIDHILIEAENRGIEKINVDSNKITGESTQKTAQINPLVFANMSGVKNVETKEE